MFNCSKFDEYFIEISQLIIAKIFSNGFKICGKYITSKMSQIFTRMYISSANLHKVMEKKSHAS